MPVSFRLVPVRCGPILACAVLLGLPCAPEGHAQSPTLLRLRNAASADRVVVDSAGGFVVKGGPGAIPATGAGGRMMWYPKKFAFRAGFATGTQWDDASIGFYSLAGGDATVASGSG